MAGDGKRKSIFHRNPYRVITVGSIILAITAVLFFINENIPKFGSPRSNRYQKHCFSNQRVLLGAVEIYNMDHTVFITDLNYETIDLLIKSKYLKANPSDGCECEYFTEGDLSADGYIYCLNHGSENRKKEGKDIEA